MNLFIRSIALYSIVLLFSPSLLSLQVVMCDDYKPSFPLGGAAAAYQVLEKLDTLLSMAYATEGAAFLDGRQASIWDTFSHIPGKTKNNENGDVAIDFYHKYKEDIALMKSLDLKMFRFSISWSRLIPDGTGEVNTLALDFYNDVINELLGVGIEPHITLYHWDFPQALEDKYGGWLNETSISDFAAYAKICFASFGDRVKFWTTFNEPWTFIFLGYEYGTNAPGRCSDRSKCSEGNSTEEPWIVVHNVLLSHALAVKEFRNLLPAGKISLNLNSDWGEPLSTSDQDIEASQRFMDFRLGLFADPIYHGKYPDSVRERIYALPYFSEEEQTLLKDSVDYFALNHYTSQYIQYVDSSVDVKEYASLSDRDGTAIGAQADSDWLHVVPWGLGKLLVYIKDKYHDPDIYITESGVDVPNESNMAISEALNDDFRINYYKEYLTEALKAHHQHGVKLKGYFAWSIFDNFEWAEGYSKRFGIVYVDYNTLTRYVKKSAYWLTNYFSGQYS